MKDEDPTVTLACALAHNRLQLWTISNPPTLLFDQKCEVQCLLYAATLRYDQEVHDLIFSAGTVFNEILIWRPLRSPKVCHIIFY